MSKCGEHVLLVEWSIRHMCVCVCTCMCFAVPEIACRCDLIAFQTALPTSRVCRAPRRRVERKETTLSTSCRYEASCVCPASCSHVSACVGPRLRLRLEWESCWQGKRKQNNVEASVPGAMAPACSVNCSSLIASQELQLASARTAVAN